MKEGFIIAPPFKGFNRYKIDGDTTILYLERKDKTVIETFIDTGELDKLIKLGYRWYARHAKNTDTYYAKSTVYYGEYGNRQHTTYHLNTIIMDCPQGKKVDHIDHNTLNNKKENLRITNNEENTKHRKGKNSNNSSGYRNVSKVNNKWYIQMQIDGRNTVLKKFPLDQLEEAGIYAETMRHLYYEKFAGAN